MEIKGNKPSCAMIADRNVWQHAIWGRGGWSGPIFLENRCLLCIPPQVSVGGRRLYRWIMRWVSSDRLSIMTMSLSAAVGPQFATQIFGVGLVPLFGDENKER